MIDNIENLEKITLEYKLLYLLIENAMTLNGEDISDVDFIHFD